MLTFFTLVNFYAQIFSSRSALEQFTFSLNSLSSDNACTHCGKNDQWVSHGYIFKASPGHHDPIAGKRILCSNRYGRSGCGRTRQLYLDDVIPHRQYRLSVVTAFIQALLGGIQVEQAYRDAIGSILKDARHAWRWINDFFKTLPTWRTLDALSFRAEQAQRTIAKKRSHRLATLLPTLSLLSGQLSQYQRQFQRAFF